MHKTVKTSVGLSV